MPVTSNSEYGNRTNVAALFQDDEIRRGIKIAAFLLLLLVSLLGNTLLIAVLCKNANQRMRTPSNYFIFNMACADMLLTLYCLPQNAIITAYQYRWLISGVAGQVLCSLSFFTGQMTVLVSTGSLLVIALDRFILVFYPLKRIITVRVARYVIVVVWFSAIIFSLPFTKMSTILEINPGLPVCTLDFKSIHFVVSYFLFCFPIIIGLPLITIIAMYIAIGIKLKRTKAPGNQLPLNQERRERMNHKILTMLVAIVAVLIICRFPLILGIISCFSGFPHVCVEPNVMFVGWFLTFTNSGINPWIYLIFNEQFRHGARLLLEKLFPCCFKATNEVDVMETDGLQMTTHSPQH